MVDIRSDIASGASGGSIFVVLGSWLLLDDVEHLPLDGLLLEHKAVLVPDEVGVLGVEGVTLHAAFEKTDDVGIIRVLGEAQATAVMHELLEFLGLIPAELFDGGLLLLLFDVGILLSLGSTGETLPWERTFQKVEDHMTNGFKVITSRLFITKMGVDGGVPSSSSEVLAIPEGDVLTIRRLEALGETKINDVDSVFGLIVTTNEEVVRFDITVDNALFMDNFDPLDHLNGDMQDSLEVEFATALLEQVFERLSEQVHHHNMVHLAIFSLLVTDKMEVWHSGLSPQLVDEFGLPEKHDVLLVLDGFFNLGGKEVSGLFLLHLVEFTEGTTA
jgi:hypothetical protein